MNDNSHSSEQPTMASSSSSWSSSTQATAVSLAASTEHKTHSSPSSSTSPTSSLIIDDRFVFASVVDDQQQQVWWPALAFANAHEMVNDLPVMITTRTSACEVKRILFLELLRHPQQLTAVVKDHQPVAYLLGSSIPSGSLHTIFGCEQKPMLTSPEVMFQSFQYPGWVNACEQAMELYNQLHERLAEATAAMASTSAANSSEAAAPATTATSTTISTTATKTACVESPSQDKTSTKMKVDTPKSTQPQESETAIAPSSEKGNPTANETETTPNKSTLVSEATKDREEIETPNHASVSLLSSNTTTIANPSSSAGPINTQMEVGNHQPPDDNTALETLQTQPTAHCSAAAAESMTTSPNANPAASDLAEDPKAASECKDSDPPFEASAKGATASKRAEASHFSTATSPSTKPGDEKDGTDEAMGDSTPVSKEQPLLTRPSNKKKTSSLSLTKQDTCHAPQQGEPPSTTRTSDALRGAVAVTPCASANKKRAQRDSLHSSYAKKKSKTSATKTLSHGRFVTPSDQDRQERIPTFQQVKPLLVKAGFAFHDAIFAFPQKDPYTNKSAVQGQDYFTSLADFRTNLCQFGLVNYIAWDDHQREMLRTWIRYNIVTGLEEGEEVPVVEGLKSSEAWAVLTRLGFTYASGSYYKPNTDRKQACEAPGPRQNKFSDPLGHNGVYAHLARFGLPDNNTDALTPTERLSLELYLASGDDPETFERLCDDAFESRRFPTRAAAVTPSEANASSIEPKQAAAALKNRKSQKAKSVKRTSGSRQVGYTSAACRNLIG